MYNNYAMTVDQVDLPKPTEGIINRRPRLLFHQTSIPFHGIDSIQKIGLLAKVPVLTPLLDIAIDYTGNGRYLTFWYPQTGEVDRAPNTKVTPKVTITDDLRKRMIDEINKMDIDPFHKRAYISLVERSSTYLPGSRMRAVADTETSSQNAISLLSVLPDEKGMMKDPNYDNDIHILTLYADAQQRTDLIKKVEEVLNKMEIVFIDPSLTKEMLAEDIVQTYFEHYLLSAGDSWSSQKSQEENLNRLNSITYDNPVYERYRRILIKRLSNKLRTNQT
jgi:hypothetical protein